MVVREDRINKTDELELHLLREVGKSGKREKGPPESTSTQKN